MKKQHLITLVIAVIIAAGAFFGGLTFQKSRDSLAGLSGQQLMTKMQSLGMSENGSTVSQNVNGRSDFPGGFPGGVNGRRFGGGGFINGQVVSMDSQSITVKQQDGSTKTVYYSSSTTVSKTTTGSSSDLIVGAEVSANGTSNSDGSVSAQTIQIQPATAPTT